MSGLSSIALPAGGAPKAIAATLMGGTAFAVDATNAYVAAGKDLKRVKLADGTTDTLVTEAATIYDVAVDAGSVYYATGVNIMKVSATAAAGSAGVVAATAIDDGMAQGVTISAGYALYATGQAFNLESQALAQGGVEVKIGASQDELVFGHRSVQADATNVYWANHGIVTAPFTGVGVPAQMTIAAPIDTKKVIAYAVDPVKKMSYFATDDGSFEKSAFDKGNMDAIWVARALPTVTSVVLDDTSVYLSSQCKILKSAR
jgi:hypothetical protein